MTIITTPALEAAIAALREAEKKIDGEGLRPPRQLAGRREGPRRHRSREEEAAEKDRGHD